MRNDIQEIKDKLEHIICDLEVEYGIIIDYTWNFVTEGSEVPELFGRPNF